MDSIRIAAAALLASGIACGDNSISQDDAACDPSAEPCTLERTLSTLEVAPGFEDVGVCQSWTLNNPTELWVRSITQENTGAYHHANWFFVPDNNFDVEDGLWSCRDQNFRELEAALLGGFLFALSTQSQIETQSFPAGGAVRIPPYSRIVGNSHILNSLDVEVTTEMKVKLETVPATDVAAKLVPARMTYFDLTLEAQSRTSFTTECMIDRAHQDTLGTSLSSEIYYVLSHYHELGRYAQLEVAGGPRDGEVIFRADGFGENFGTAIDPPFDLAEAGAEGVRLTCGFDNPRDEAVGWGFGDQEMCVIAIMSRTDLGWDGTALEGERVGVADDGEVNYAGPCSVFGVPWDHNKPGGPQR